MAKAYVDWLKCRRKRAATMAAVKTKMQKELLSRVWERLEEQQERAFDEAIAARVLDQSTYEKQIVTKLCEVRDQKNIMAENQMILEKMAAETSETEYRMSFEREKDLACKKQRDVEIECQRMCELRRRLHEEKVRKLHEKHRALCRETVQDLVNLALKIEDYRRANDGCVPESILREWKTMFVRCQPLFDENITCAIDIDVEGDEERVLEEVSRIKIEKTEVLQDALFDDYVQTNPPWNAFAPLLAEDALEMFELGRVVLGYVVHRLLNYAHSDRIDRSRISLPKAKNAAIIVGVASPTVHESLGKLLESNEIRLVRMEDAINYCLQQYKNEMLDVDSIDANVIAATDAVVNELKRGKRGMGFLRRLSSVRLKSEEDATSRRSRSSGQTLKRQGNNETDTKVEEKSKARDKQTQTPRNLPYDDLDATLTDSAYIGKWAYEYLVLGEPITNELTTKILIEYLKSLDGVKSWAVIDYPNTYEQMSLLEAALTGSKIPPNPEVLDFEDVSIEDVESIEPRIIYEDDFNPIPLYRQSRLVPDPIKRIEDIQSPTFAKLFVRVAQKPKNFEPEDRSYEILKEDAPSIDKFYAFQRVGYLLYYTSLDSTTLRALARLVIGTNAEGKPSEELFGDAPKSHERSKERSTGSKAPVIKRTLPPSDGDEETEQSQEEEYDDFQMDFDPRQPRPGEANWEWIEVPLPFALVEYLANLWEDMEKMYTVNLKELLFLKSVHASGVIPYKDCIARNATEFIKRPCNKQDLLHQFHLAFNAIDEDARHDADVKCELHRRVADFQTQLWDICDRRRLEAEEERIRFVDQEWTVHDATILFNVYVGIIQAELDRFIDTMHLIQDYYLTTLKRPLQETRFSKVVLNRMQVGHDEPVNFQEQPESSKPAEKLTDRKETKRSKVKAGSPKSIAVSSSPLAVEYSLLRKEIYDLLVDRKKPFGGAENASIFKIIMENVRYARNIVDAVSTRTNDILKRETAATSKSKDFSVDLTDSVAVKTASRGPDVLLEWRYATTFEIDRIRAKLDAIAAAARTEVVFLLETMQKTFHQFYDSIVDRYWREMKSVNEMANVFCFAIEEARFLEREMLLEDDRFVIRSNVFVMELPPKRRTTVKEVASDTRFRVGQIARLMEVLRRVAPHGTMSERAFVYILQDLVSHGMEEGERISLPCCWYRLRSTDVSCLVDRLFESADYVDWREFVVYALELPLPSHRDILLARDRFRIQDQDLNELVTVAQYLWTPLWFLECTGTDVDVWKLLSDDYQRNRDELYDEELYHFSRDEYDRQSLLRAKASSISILDTCCSNPEEMLRLILAKDLLCRMYMVDQRTVNYTALLLAFCKDEDPREGFAKALALALGTRVCTDVDEGERYVEKLYEQRRVARRVQTSREAFRHETKRIIEGIVRRLMHKVDESIGWTIGKQSLEDFDQTISVHDYDEGVEHGRISIISSSIFGEGDFECCFTEQEAVIYWLSLDVCLTVLAATLPWHVLKPEIFEPCLPSLRDSLTFVYQQLRDDDLTDDENVVLAHRLLNHEFMIRLLGSVSNFTAKNMGNMIREILRTREDANLG
ncbi:sperm flagellar protein 2 [Colletes latitarsis]|uniref:sperm flagellar protein 2 n=1 Tax=Colletes latitarsis TaxID=2605962 RepID=UPI00403620DF